MAEHFESVGMQLRRGLRGALTVRQHGEVHVGIDSHGRGHRLMIESDVVDDQDDVAAVALDFPRRRYDGRGSDGPFLTCWNGRRGPGETEKKHPQQDAEETDDGSDDEE